MDNSKKKRKKSRAMRVMRVRKALRGSAQRPRFSVSKTNAHIYAQIIDDENGVTLVGLGTQSKTFSMKERSKHSARELGKQVA